MGWPFGLSRNSSPPKTDPTPAPQTIAKHLRNSKADSHLLSQSDHSSDEEIRSDDSDEDEEEEEDGEELGYGDRPLVTGVGSTQGEERGRRLSVTREAERRTSLEDDEEEEDEEEDGVVHVGLRVGDESSIGKGGHPHPGMNAGTEDDGDGELVEVHHPLHEMRGVEEAGVEGGGGEVGKMTEEKRKEMEKEVVLEERGSLQVSEK